jgi:hypothetical protein
MNDSCHKPAPPRPGDVRVVAPDDATCGLPAYGNLHTGIYTDGGRMCDPGAHPLQAPDDVTTMHASDEGAPATYGAPGFHCEANPVPPLPWAAIGFRCLRAWACWWRLSSRRASGARPSRCCA